MRLRSLVLGLVTAGAVALAAAPAQAAPAVCPASFSVLHDDRIGSVAVPAGPYALTLLDDTQLSCASAAAAFRRFLEDFDGRLPSPWFLDALTGTFFRGAGGAGFQVRPLPAPTPSGGGTTVPSGRRCPGTFRVLHNDRIGGLRVPAGRYRVTLGPTRPVSCAASSRALARFLACGRLPRAWRLAPATGTFTRNGVAAFRIKRTVAVG